MYVPVSVEGHLIGSIDGETLERIHRQQNGPSRRVDQALLVPVHNGQLRGRMCAWESMDDIAPQFECVEDLWLVQVREDRQIFDLGVGGYTRLCVVWVDGWIRG